MAYRITKTTLQNQLDRLNAKLHEAAHMDLDFAECYGGAGLDNRRQINLGYPRKLKGK